MYDLLIIGGGVNGAGIARDAAGRGFSVLLCEANDLASGTSSWSSKLVHGGLRYLEHYEFRLVREALIEREVLWGIAPHIIRPLRFVLPHHRSLRPEWMIRAGLLLYDHMGGRKKLPPSRRIDLRGDAAGAPLLPRFNDGFEYSDCRVDDSRLVVLNARDAADRGAEIRVGTRVTGAVREAGHWRASLVDHADGATGEIEARYIVNAGGPWVADVHEGMRTEAAPIRIRKVQGSHIVVRRLYDHDRCYTFQESDGRVIFAIPYERDFTLIGTTDRDYHGDPADAAISDDETDYLLAAAADYFAKPPTRDDIVWTYSGVRPLYDDGASKAQEATRDYVLKTDGDDAVVLNIIGGKITTYRRLAEEAMERIERTLGRRGSAWTATAPLPGGDFPTDGVTTLETKIIAAHPYLDAAHAARLARHYGTSTFDLLGDREEAADLGEHFGADLYACEVDWLIGQEWARSADDVLWRRTKLGLRLNEAETADLAVWMDGRAQAA